MRREWVAALLQREVRLDDACGCGSHDVAWHVGRPVGAVGRDVRSCAAGRSRSSWAATAPARARCSTSSPAFDSRPAATCGSTIAPLAHWDPRARARVVAHLPQIVRPDLPFLAGELVLMGRYPHTDRWFEGDEDRAAVERAMRRTGLLGTARSAAADAERRRASARAAGRLLRAGAGSCCCSTSRRRISTSISSCTASRCCATRARAAPRAWPSRTISISRWPTRRGSIVLADGRVASTLRSRRPSGRPTGCRCSRRA